MIEIISLHIAKTGGRSFFETLKDQYGEMLDPRYKRIHYFPKKNYNNKLINRIPEHIKIMHGHLFYDHIEEIHKKYNPKIISWFRDPVERVISNYYYLMTRLREDTQHPQKEKRNFTLTEYAENSLKNKMTRYLKGIDIEELFFFGFTEEYNDGIKKLSELLKWDKPVLQHHINKGTESDLFSDIKTQRSDITEAMKDEIKKLNPDDIALYEKAKKLYKTKFNA